MDYKRKLYRELAGTIDARRSCERDMNTLSHATDCARRVSEAAECTCIKALRAEWFDKHTDTIEQIVSDFLPSGSGWDNGTKIDLDNSTGEKIVLYGAYHHMNENGYYDGWTEHTITVRPSLVHEITLSISGRDRNEIKDYLSDLFSSDLVQVIDWDENGKHWKRAA